MASAPEPLLVWGAGGHGRVLADVVRACGFALVGFAEADPAKRGSVAEPGGARVLLTQDELLERFDGSMRRESTWRVALGIGDNDTRLRARIILGGHCAPPLIHPAATVSPSVSLGLGTVVFPGAVVNAGATLGEAVVINSGAVVEHDCIIGDGAHVAPHATVAGGVRVGYRSWIGAGATVLQNLQIGDDVIVGAGAVVLRDIADGIVVVGVPARSLSRAGRDQR